MKPSTENIKGLKNGQRSSQEDNSCDANEEFEDDRDGGQSDDNLSNDSDNDILPEAKKQDDRLIL